MDVSVNKILTPDFFNRPVVKVAKDLLGKFLVRKIGNKRDGEQEIRLEINEVEAYDGPSDLACHGRFGKTPRTEPMFGSAGYFYIYFVYGVHWMLNVVTGPKDYPAAVLIRGAGDLRGPAKLTKFLQIDKSFNSKMSASDTGLWIEDSGIVVSYDKIIATPRIGVEYAGPIWSGKKYRFLIRR